MNTIRTLLAAIAVIVPMLVSAQDVGIESSLDVDKTKSELFAITKSFIADSWSNSKEAITSENEELGYIQVSADYNANVKVGMGLGCVYEYDYKVRFRVKDGKCKVEIYDIVCMSASQIGLGNSYSVPLIPYFEGDDVPKKLKTMGRGLSKKQAIKMMDELRGDMQNIIQSYFKYIKDFTSDF